MTTGTRGQDQGRSRLAEYFVAGGAAGAVSRTVVSPLERLKIIFQCQDPRSPHYRGLWPSLRQIAIDEGWKGFFKGNGVNVIRIAPYSAIQFTSYEMAKTVLMGLSETGQMRTGERLVAGAMAGISSVVTTYPLDLVRSRMSIMTARIGHAGPEGPAASPGMVATALLVFRNEGGLRGLYRGLVPTVLGVAPYVGSNFAAYEFLKSKLLEPPSSTHEPQQQQLHAQEYTVLRKLACGALAGAFSQTLTYPLDVLRRRMQVAGMPSLDFQYTGPLHALSCIIKTEGFLGLYKGLWPNFLKVAPSIGTSFVTYELVRDFLLTF